MSNNDKLLNSLSAILQLISKDLSPQGTQKAETMKKKLTEIKDKGPKPTTQEENKIVKG